MKKKRKLGLSSSIIILTFIIGILGTIFSILGVEGTVTNIEKGEGLS